MKRLSLLLGAAALMMTPVVSGCLASPSAEEAPIPEPKPVESPPLPEGTYDVQGVSYDDASGLYRMMVLGAPTPAYQTTQLRMARISDEDIAAGKKMHLSVDAEGPVLNLTPDDKIEYTHNVVEDRGGQPVVVQQQSSMWSPFMAGMTGAMIGNMLFAPRYYYPPPFAGGGMMGGFGGAGTSLSGAQQDFRGKHGALPQAAKLSQSGFSKAPSAGLKSTGSGAGSSKMKSGAPAPPKKKFGGGRGFGGRRR